VHKVNKAILRHKRLVKQANPKVALMLMDLAKDKDRVVKLILKSSGFNSSYSISKMLKRAHLAKALDLTKILTSHKQKLAML
jgi:hypothetical protein